MLLSFLFLVLSFLSLLPLLLVLPFSPTVSSLYFSSLAFPFLPFPQPLSRLIPHSPLPLPRLIPSLPLPLSLPFPSFSFPLPLPRLIPASLPLPLLIPARLTSATDAVLQALELFIPNDYTKAPSTRPPFTIHHEQNGTENAESRARFDSRRRNQTFKAIPR